MLRRNKLLLIIGLALLVILLIVGVLMGGIKKKVSVVEEKPLVQEEKEFTQPVITPVQQEQREARVKTSSVQSLAKTFTERYGSFSTEADFANLKDVLPLMTDDFAQQTENYIKQAQVGETFYGVTTKVVSLKVNGLDEETGRAMIILSTQRQEAYDNPQNISLKYQDLVLEMEKISGVWKVSSAIWQ